MNRTMMNFTRWILVSVLCALLGACGGGGGSGGTSLFGSGDTSGSGTSGGTPTTTAGTIALSLSSSTVTASAPVTVTAVAKTSTGAAAVGVVVTFSVTNAHGALSAASALTDASGSASVTLSPASGQTSGADTVVASATVGGSTVSASAGFSLTATSVGISTFSADVGTSANNKLSAYGQAVLTLSMTGVSASNPVTVSFTSPCIVANKASVTSSSVTSNSNTILLTYQDNGCGATTATDVVSASVTGSSLNASVTLYPTTPTANSVAFLSASPSTIYLQGSGLTLSSTVKFQVNDSSSNALPNQVVTLALSTLTGGLLLDGGSAAVTKTTDANGQVSAIVTSGTVPTPVRVTATLASGVSSTSSNLAVAVGLPTQLAFSLSQATLNIEGGNVDGTGNTYTVYAADRSGNPVPAGTAVTFWAEGGQITGSQLTTLNGSGIASATASFVSQEPRPADGRVTILAYAIGEESFRDLNGNNTWDSGEPFQDLGDVVKDMRFDGVYDASNDEYVSLAGTASAGSLSCSDFSSSYPILAVGADTPSRAGTCDQTWTRRTYVRRAAETVLSTSTARALWADASGLHGYCNTVSLKTSASDSGTAFTYVESYALNTATQKERGAWYASGTSGTLRLIVADANSVRLNPMAAGTTVSVTSNTDGLTATVTGGSPVASTLTATSTLISYSFTTATSGFLTVNFTSPSGLQTSYTLKVYNSSTTPSCSAG
jgi:hypothetical protein